MAALAVPKLFQPTLGVEGCMCVSRGCVCTWWFVNSCVAQEHTTHLLEVFETLISVYTCQLVLTQE